jgi:hypothetical protein
VSVTLDKASSLYISILPALSIFISGAAFLPHHHSVSNFLNSAFILSKKSLYLKSHFILFLISHKASHASPFFLFIHFAAFPNISVAFFLVAVNHPFITSEYSFHCFNVVFHNASFTSGSTLPTILLIALYHQGILSIQSSAAVSRAVVQASHLVGNFHSDNVFNHNISAVHSNVFLSQLH